MPSSSLRILGIDPALRITGYGAIERRNGTVHLIEAGVVMPSIRGTLEERPRSVPYAPPGRQCRVLGKRALRFIGICFVR